MGPTIIPKAPVEAAAARNASDACSRSPWYEESRIA